MLLRPLMLLLSFLGATSAGGSLGQEVLLCTCYDYDDAGRQTAVFHPDGAVTRSEYNGLGRLLLTTENADAAQPELVRRTAHAYDPDTGQLLRMAAVLPEHNGGAIGGWDDIDWDAADGSLQVTEFLYGGHVVDEDGRRISFNNTWIGQVCYPDRLTGQPDPLQSLRLSYFGDGSVACRVDAREIVFEHTYDELDRRIETGVDDSAWFGSADPNTPPPDRITPPDRISRILYDYAPDGMLERVTAEADDPNHVGQSTIVAQNAFEYDGFNNLLADRQQHFATLAPDSPAVDYAWEFSPTAAYNFNRLVSITYPERPSDATRRTIEFDYGNNTDDLDSALSRITQVTDLLSGAQSWYDYAGTSRRVAMGLGSVITQDFSPTGTGYDGLDRFGRVADLHFKDDSQQTVHRYEYGYDAAGNRTHVRVTQWPTPGHDQVNDRSYLYDYDELRRLTAADLGALDGSNSAIVDDPSIALRRTLTWQLDNLGNWSAGVADDSYVVEDDLDGDGVYDATQTAHHATNAANEIESLVSDADPGDPNDPNAPPVVTDFVHDAAGSLVFDGQHWYQHDGWNRLVQVNAAGTLDPNDFLADGQLDPARDPAHQPGDRLALLTYDGLGRLIRKQSSPIGDPNAIATEDYYYDGVRRIQEVREQEQPESTETEYIYGPDYVDEFAFQIDPAGRVFYILQDANYNVTVWSTRFGGACLTIFARASHHQDHLYLSRRNTCFPRLCTRSGRASSATWP